MTRPNLQPDVNTAEQLKQTTALYPNYDDDEGRQMLLGHGTEKFCASYYDGLARGILTPLNTADGYEQARTALLCVIHEYAFYAAAAGLKVESFVDCVMTQTSALPLVTATEARRAYGYEWVNRRHKQIKPEICPRFGNEYDESARLDAGGVDQLGRRLESYEKEWGYYMTVGFGIEKFDDATGGLMPGEICVITGGPGTAKTSLALAAVDDFINNHDAPALYVSADMSAIEMQMRLLERVGNYSEPTLRRLIAGGDPEYKAILEQERKRYGGKLAIIENQPDEILTLDKILDEALVRKSGLIVIDYLTRLKKASESDLEFCNYAVPKLEAHVRRYQTPIIILNQMSRASRNEQSAGRLGGHGRGGGVIEELAYLEIELIKDSGKIVACITKARRGSAPRSFALMYDGSRKTFTGEALEVVRSSVREKQSAFEVKGTGEKLSNN